MDEITVHIMAYHGDWPVGYADRQDDGTFLCRILEDPYKLEVRSETARTERIAVRLLNRSRWTTKTKKIRMPPRESAVDLWRSGGVAAAVS